MTVYFLYTRLPGYFLACIEALVSREASIKVFCVAKKPSTEAPYSLIGSSRISIRYKEDLATNGLELLLEDSPPDLIFVSGWVDKEYTRIARKYRTKIPVIVGVDNPWIGSVKQKLATIVATARLKKTFGYIWVPGNRQYEFARRLGFSNNQILKGLYCADVHTSRVGSEQQGLTNKTALFVGRFVAYKKSDWLLNAFTNFLKQGKFTDWSLVLIGNGPLSEELKTKAAPFPQVQVLDFMQPSEIASYYQKASLFCFPSSHEHWGLVVHEAAAAGLPLLLSDSCAAGDEFLIHGHNGLVFETDNYNSFVRCFSEMLRKPEGELARMGAASAALAKRITHDTWCATLLSVLKR